MRIKTHLPGLALLLLAGLSNVAFAQTNTPAAKPAVGAAETPAATYGAVLSIVESQIVSAAEAMPEDKYDFVPTQGEFKTVRSFGAQIGHVAEANTFFFRDPSKPMVDNRADFAKLKTKAELVKALKDSFAMAHAYVDAITPQNAFVTIDAGGEMGKATRASMATFGMAHMMDHYGQLVVYLRLNGIVPPASRKGGM